MIAYEQYCKENGYIAVDRATVKKKLENKLGKMPKKFKMNGHSRDGFYGIGLKKDYPGLINDVTTDF